MLKTSDMRHNHNSYCYLKEFAPFINQTVLSIIPELAPLKTLINNPYDENFAYGDMYSFVISLLENSIDLIYPRLNSKETQALDALIYVVYHNNNHILEDSEWFKKINAQIRPEVDTERMISDHLKDHNPAINKSSPKKEQTISNRFYNLFTPNFKPQHLTNIPSIKNHSYQSDIDLIEYRFSTQGQRHNGQVRVSPLFKRWLAISAKSCPQDKLINHIYFNNLGLDRSKFDILGTNEKELTKTLHQLEDDPLLKVSVITLPACQGLMSLDHYKMTNKHIAYSCAFSEFIGIARDEKNQSGITDFKISPKIRSLLFGNKENETKVLTQLITKSFAAMGISSNELISSAQRQAVWLHFIKFELTQYILKTLKPASCNFSCKDAIDRGAVSSVYYNLHQSFSLNHPMSRDEFERDLNSAAVNVKGRGINFHRKILWNALDVYINANYHSLLNDEKKSWLIYWRDMNCPSLRVKSLLGERLKQYEEQLNTLNTEQKKIKEQGLKLLAAVKIEYEQQVNGQSLLLEVISRSELLLSKKLTTDFVQDYKQLAQELKIKHPALLVVAGAMLMFLGAILFSSALVQQGKARIKTGFFTNHRNELCKQIDNIAEEHSASLPPHNNSFNI